MGKGTLERRHFRPRSKNRKGQSQTVLPQSHALSQFTNVFCVQYYDQRHVHHSRRELSMLDCVYGDSTPAPAHLRYLPACMRIPPVHFLPGHGSEDPNRKASVGPYRGWKLWPSKEDQFFRTHPVRTPSLSALVFRTNMCDEHQAESPADLEAKALACCLLLLWHLPTFHSLPPPAWTPLGLSPTCHPVTQLYGGALPTFPSD